VLTHLTYNFGDSDPKDRSADQSQLVFETVSLDPLRFMD